MNTLILNGLSNTPFTLLSYNRNTTFDVDNDHAMNSVAYFTVQNSTNTVNQLQNIGANTITNILIKYNNENIYNLSNLNAYIATINETLYEDTINVNVTINFN